MFSLSNGLGSFGGDALPVGVYYNGKMYNTLEDFFKDPANKNIFATFANASFMFKQNFDLAKTKEQREAAVNVYLTALGLADQTANASLDIKVDALVQKLADKQIQDDAKITLITALIALVSLSSLCLERLFISTTSFSTLMKGHKVLTIINRLAKLAIAGEIAVQKQIFATFTTEMSAAKDEQQMNKAFENLLKALKLANTNDTKIYWDGTVPQLQQAINNAITGQKPDADQKEFLVNLYALIAFLFGYTGLEWAKTITANSVVKKLFGILKQSAIQQKLDELAGPQAPVETKSSNGALVTGLVLAAVGAIGAYAWWNSKVEKKFEDHA